MNTRLLANDRFVSLSPAAGTTMLAYDFELLTQADLTLIRRRGEARTNLVNGVDYLFPTGIGGKNGGSVQLVAPALDGDVYQLVGLETIERVSDFLQQQRFEAAKFNADLDKLTRVNQEARRDIGRALKVDFGRIGGRVDIPPEGHFLKTDAAGNLIDGGSASDIENAQKNAAQAAADRQVVEAAAQTASNAAGSVVRSKFNSIAALQAAEFDFPPAFAQTSSHSSFNDLGGAEYAVVDSEPLIWNGVAEGPEPGSFPLPNISKWARLIEDGPKVTHFGAISTRANNQPYLQDALDYMDHVSNGVMHIPRGTYLFEGQLTARKPRMLTGDGPKSSILKCTASLGPEEPAFQANISEGLWGINWNGFCVTRYDHIFDFNNIGEEHTDVIARAIQINIMNEAAYFSRFVIENIEAGDFGRPAFTMNNGLGSIHGGFFCGSVKNCLFWNGFRGNLVGDSLGWYENQIQSGPLGTLPSMRVSGVAGARNYVLRDNNLTCRGGAGFFQNCDQLELTNNWGEQGHWWSDGKFTGGLHDMLGYWHLVNCLAAVIKGNTTNPFPGELPGHTTENPRINDTAPEYAWVFDGDCARLEFSGKNDTAKGSVGHVLVSPSVVDGKRCSQATALSGSGA